MQKWIKSWRCSMATLFFITLIGFCMVRYNHLGGQLFGDEKALMSYFGLLALLSAWIMIEVSLVKLNLLKILIPISIGLVFLSAILINGYLSLISGLILTVFIALYYLPDMKKNINQNQIITTNKKIKKSKSISEEQPEEILNV